MARQQFSMEDNQLKKNLESQLDRLIKQLQDLEQCKDEMDVSEYMDMKDDTMHQLNEFDTSLIALQFGDISLQDDISAMRLAVEAAISKAFKTPEVIKIFSKKEPDALRQRLYQIDRDVKIGHRSLEDVTQEKLEILSALKKLGQVLKSEEDLFFYEHSAASMKKFQEAASDYDLLNIKAKEEIEFKMQGNMA